MRLFTVVALATSILVTAAANAAPLDGKWRLASLPDVSTFDAAKTELAFLERGRVAMTVGCNRMSASVSIGEGTLKFGPVVATKMACLPQLMLLEASFQSAIGRTATYKRDGGTLTLLDDSNGIVATFTRKD